MAFKLAICSGKGGAGKTSVAVNLFHTIRSKWTPNVQLIDCDVEEPNDLLFFQKFKLLDRSVIQQDVPFIDESKCTFCGKCSEYCEFNAISIMPSVRYAEIDPNMCHSCGACLHACRYKAIGEIKHPIGELSSYSAGKQVDILEGNLRIGSPMQTRVIKELKRAVSPEAEILIYDAPPGTSCPVVETVSGADYVILITEPTPFGLHDLSLTVELMKEMKKPFGVIVNKAGLGDREVYGFLKDENIDLLAEIPFDFEYASQYAKGNLLTDIPPWIEQAFLKLAIDLKNRIIHD